MHFERKTIHIELRESATTLRQDCKLGVRQQDYCLASSTDCGPHLFVMPLRERPMLFCPARGEDLCRPQSYSQILKNAILIVEFARQKEEEGVASGEAAVHAARTRLRPILMTSLSFILGVAPLAVATGAGAEMRQSLGTAVLFGMLGVTCFGLLFTPAFTPSSASSVVSKTEEAVPMSAPFSSLETNENRRFLAEIAPEAPALGLKLFVD
jgi:hypothetical protein